MTVVKLEWRWLGFAWIFFAASSAAWHTVPEKMIFGSGKSFLIVGEWRLLGFAGTGKLPGKKWFLGWENHFVKLESGGCWDLLGFFFAVSILLLARLPGKESGGCWDLLGFLLLRCLLLFGRVPGKKVIFGLGKSFCEIGEWRLLGFAVFFCGVYIMLLARLPGKESGGCWDLLGFLLLRCLLLFGRVPGKKMIFGWGKWFFWTGIAGICWDFSFFALSTATWQTARKKMIFGSGKSFFWNWRVAIAGICWDFFFYGVDCCLAECRGKKWFLGGENDFSELGLLGFAGISPFLRCLLLLGRLPGKKWFLGRGNHFSEIGD